MHILCFKIRDNSVGTALRYGLDGRGSRVRFPAGAGNYSLHHRVQNGSGAHPASYAMGTRCSFLRSKAARAWSWPLTSISCRGQRMSGAVPPLPQYDFISTGKTLHTMLLPLHRTDSREVSTWGWTDPLLAVTQKVFSMQQQYSRSCAAEWQLGYVRNASQNTERLQHSVDITAVGPVQEKTSILCTNAVSTSNVTLSGWL
jgi:hypothetical protein